MQDRVAIKTALKNHRTESAQYLVATCSKLGTVSVVNQVQRVWGTQKFKSVVKTKKQERVVKTKGEKKTALQSAIWSVCGKNKSKSVW